MTASHVCPVWVGHLLASPIRKLWHPPKTILRPFVEPGMCALDLGCALGYFSLPLARLVGDTGQVICVDVQERMLERLKKRTQRSKLRERLVFHHCAEDSLALKDYAEKVDFALAFAVVHEMPDADRLFAELFDLVKPRGILMLAEPKGHVTKTAFRETVSLIENNGFDIIERPRICGTYSLVFKRAAMPGMVVSSGN